MKRLDDLISDIPVIYNVQWFTESKQLFYDHPMNVKKADEIESLEGDENNHGLKKKITLFDFLLGAKYVHYDEIHDDWERTNKMIQVGEYDYKVKVGCTLIPSSKFYPNITYGKIKDEILATLEKMISQVNGHVEKRKMISYVRRLLNEKIILKSQVENIVYNNKFVKYLIDEIDAGYSFLEEVLEVLNNNQDFLEFDIDTAKLAKLYLFLNTAEILKNDKTSFLSFASTYFKVTKKGKSTLPNKGSLKTEIGELKRNWCRFARWYKEQSLEIK